MPCFSQRYEGGLKGGGRSRGGGRGVKGEREGGPVNCHLLRALIVYGEQADIKAGCGGTRRRKQSRQKILEGARGRTEGVNKGRECKKAERQAREEGRQEP